jgi:hypothetical protein
MARPDELASGEGLIIFESRPTGVTIRTSGVVPPDILRQSVREFFAERALSIRDRIGQVLTACTPRRVPRPRRRSVRRGPRKARAPDDDGSSGHLEELEESSGCSRSPKAEAPRSSDEGRLAAVYRRWWAHEARRLARRRFA